jgi:uncharacterized protein (DUF1800 family)
MMSMRPFISVCAVFLGGLLAGPVRAVENIPSVTLVATVPKTDETARAPGVFTFTRTGGATESLTIAYAVSGNAVPGKDYPALPGTLVLPAGASSATLEIKATAGFDNKPVRTVVLHLKLDHTYAPASPSTATIEIAHSPPALYVAALRPGAAAPDSTGYGTATLLLAADETRARVVVGYSNLTSTPVSGHLKLGAPGEDGVYVHNFPAAQPATFDWMFTATGQLGAADLLAALKEGRIYAVIDSLQHPNGEIRAQFIRSAGSLKFNPPPAPPALPPPPITERDAARFLTQATFGPTRAEIADLVARKNPGAWIDEQMATPISTHRDAARADFEAFPPGGIKPKVNSANRQTAWWKIALTGRDQLRQRVAFALSEILVVSDVNDTLAGNTEGLANYYDLLARDAFGNFRDLLEDVTLSPVMGNYLSHLRNARADPKLATSPDENYAREVMQLFTIGLNQLQPDGTLRLGDDGLPIPTYDQNTIIETSRVFTGWGYYSSAPKPNFRGAHPTFFAPMMLYPEAHDDGAKTIVGGVKLPAGQGGAKDLKDTLDTLFNHPNTGPFICRQLIQRLVTSNPSPAYVYRVSQVFARNGTGVRGDLGAVIRAILLDYEARSPAVLDHIGYGKLKEPLLRVTALWRAFDAGAKNGRYLFANPESPLAQAALHSPTVFNFFEPDFVLPGTLAAAGLHAPDYQILTDTTAITVPNFLYSCIYTPAQPKDEQITLKLDPLLPLAKTPGSLLDYLDLVLCGGSMSAKAREDITAALAALPATVSDLDRARLALHLVVISPAAAIQL